MTKNIVIVDIDNSVHESDITMNRLSMEMFNSPFKWCKQNYWYSGQDPKMPLDHMLKMFDRMHDRDMIFYTDPCVGAKEGLELIESLGYTINYYTDRKASAHQDTCDWLAYHGLPNPTAVFCCKDKRGAIADAKDQIATIIDDRVRTLLFCRYELGIDEVFSLRYGYNCNLVDAPGVNLADTWKELSTLFVAKMGSYTPNTEQTTVA